MLNSQDLFHMQKISPFRSHRLFEEFLPRGYALTTLDTVEGRDEVIGLKVILGTLITLYDDYADRPDRLNPRLLQLLYRLPFEDIAIHQAFLKNEEKEALELARSLFKKLFTGMSKLPHYESLKNLFHFDLKQFFLANHYSELLTQEGGLINGLENKLYLHHNMGIVMAGMMDLMSLSRYRASEIGRARELFLLGQRAGRISNILSTYEREKKEGDRTNELLTCDLISLELEITRIFHDIRQARGIHSFSAKDYSAGIEQLHCLHQNLIGVI